MIRVNTYRVVSAFWGACQYDPVPHIQYVWKVNLPSFSSPRLRVNYRNNITYNLQNGLDTFQLSSETDFENTH